MVPRLPISDRHWHRAAAKARKLLGDARLATRTRGGTGHRAEKTSGHADPAVLKEAGEGGPALQHVVHGHGHVGVARELGAFGAHPGVEFRDDRGDVGLALRQALGGGNVIRRGVSCGEPEDERRGAARCPHRGEPSDGGLQVPDGTTFRVPGNRRGGPPNWPFIPRQKCATLPAARRPRAIGAPVAARLTLRLGNA